MGFRITSKAKHDHKVTSERTYLERQGWAITSGIVERRHDEPVHYSTVGTRCIACQFEGQMVWTDDRELYDRHPNRCNFAFVAMEA